jgi:hypothetical protein
MSSSNPPPRFESRDTTLCIFQDTDLQVTTAGRAVRDETLRRFLSEQFGTDLGVKSFRGDFERLLPPAREQEFFCRGANNLFGLARCLGDQALIHKAQGRSEETLALLKQLDTVSRRIDDVEGVVFALFHQAAILGSSPDQSTAALTLAEEAQGMAAKAHLSWLQNDIEALVQRLRSRIQPS